MTKKWQRKHRDEVDLKREREREYISKRDREKLKH